MSSVEIPGYKILKTLGVGGQATVYLAIQTGFDRKVALKVMSPALAADPTFGERFLREAKIVAKLSHKSIVTVYDVGESGNFYYLAMEYLPGEDLRKRIEQGLKARESLRIISKLAKALHFAHDKGYVHRDVKSENILFTNDGEPLLTDFGIAKASNSSTQMTQTGKLIGTPEYMSPEQCRGKKIDGRADLYSLGIILHEMLTRTVPFTGEDSVSVCIQHVTKPLPQLPQRLKHFQWLLNKLLAKDPAQRFQSGEELAAAVDKFRATGKPTEVIDIPVKSKKTKVSAKTKDEQADDIFEQFENQRMVENSELTEKSHLGRNIFLILIIVGVVIAGVSYQRWLPQTQKMIAEWQGTQTNENSPAADSKLDANSASPNEKLTDQASKNTTRAEANLLAEADKKISTIPHTLDDLKSALGAIDKTLKLNENSQPAKLARNNVMAIALEESSRAAQLNDFSVARQWLNWVEFVDPENALLNGAKANIASLKTQYDSRLLTQQQSVEAINNWLVAAEKALVDNRLSAPAQKNAIYFYQQVLTKDPNNEKARTGLRRVADKLEGLIGRAIEDKQFSKARRYFKRFESISSDLDKQGSFKNKIAKEEQRWKTRQQQNEKQRLAEADKRRKAQARQEKLSDPAIQLRLQALIDSATSLQQQGSLVEPVGNNAVEKFRAILKIDPQNEQALAFLSELEKQLVGETVTAISDGDKALAQIRLDKLIIFDNKHNQINELQQEIDSMIEVQPTAVEPAQVMGNDLLQDENPSQLQEQSDISTPVNLENEAKKITETGSEDTGVNPQSNETLQLDKKDADAVKSLESEKPTPAEQVAAPKKADATDILPAEKKDDNESDNSTD